MILFLVMSLTNFVHVLSFFKLTHSHQYFTLSHFFFTLLYLELCPGNPFLDGLFSPSHFESTILRLIFFISTCLMDVVVCFNLCCELFSSNHVGLKFKFSLNLTLEPSINQCVPLNNECVTQWSFVCNNVSSSLFFFFVSLAISFLL